MLRQRSQEGQRLGGTIRFGWSIWEWPNVYIEAEHHAVYESSEGILVDVTPPADDWTVSRTFLPDSAAVYDFENEGVRRDNHRLALTSDPLSEQFFQTAREFNRVMSSILVLVKCRWTWRQPASSKPSKMKIIACCSAYS